MTGSGTEIISIIAGVDYAPKFVSTDKRIPAGEKTTLGYWQIGELEQYGNAKGPVFRVEFAYTVTALSISFIKLWGIDNTDDTAVLIPVEHLKNGLRFTYDLWFRKFEFCDNTGAVVEVDPTTYSVFGYKKRVMPLAY